MVGGQKKLHDDLEAIQKGEVPPSTKQSVDRKVPADDIVTCFAKGTLVKTKEGDLPIEDINIGSIVYSFNSEIGEVELCMVTQLIRNTTLKFVRMQIGNDSINTTWGHPLWLERKAQWVEAGSLKVEDQLTLMDGSMLPIENIELVVAEEDSFNFEVIGNHNYYVGSEGVLVHNKSTSYVTNVTQVNSEIYGIWDNLKGKYVYVGKASGTSTMMTRFAKMELVHQLLAKKGQTVSDLFNFKGACP